MSENPPNAVNQILLQTSKFDNLVKQTFKVVECEREYTSVYPCTFTWRHRAPGLRYNTAAQLQLSSTHSHSNKQTNKAGHRQTSKQNGKVYREWSESDHKDCEKNCDEAE